MPSFITVTGDARCPHCGIDSMQMVHCQWGVVPHDRDYDVSDSVVWLQEAGEVVPPFSFRVKKKDDWRFNSGTPECGHVILFDMSVGLQGAALQCAECGGEFAAVAVVVQAGHFASI